MHRNGALSKEIGICFTSINRYSLKFHMVQTSEIIPIIEHVKDLNIKILRFTFCFQWKCEIKKNPSKKLLSSISVLKIEGGPQCDIASGITLISDIS